jgi:hypothetical protein
MSATWPGVRTLHKKLGKEIVEKVSIQKKPRLIEKIHDNGVECYRPTFRAFLECPKAKGDVELIYAYLEMLKEKFNQNPEIQKLSLPTISQQEKAQQLGEFFIAHEVGHALLGLNDTVLPKMQGRSPANATFSECLMHSDEGGSFMAWEIIRKWPLGKPSQCYEYNEVIRAFELRTQAIFQMKNGKQAEADLLYEEAIQVAKSSAQSWVWKVWEKEYKSLHSVVRRIFE